MVQQCTISQNSNSGKRTLIYLRAKNSFDFFAEYSPLPSAQIQQRIKLLSDGSTWIFQAKFGNNVIGSGFIPSYEELENYFTPSQSKFLRRRKDIWL